MIDVSVLALKAEHRTPFILTRVTPLRFVPVIVTVVLAPLGPVDGLIAVTVGAGTVAAGGAVPATVTPALTRAISADKEV